MVNVVSYVVVLTHGFMPIVTSVVPIETHVNTIYCCTAVSSLFSNTAPRPMHARRSSVPSTRAVP